MTNERTNLPDWSTLMPLLPDQGPRRCALYEALRRLIETRTLAPGAKLPTTRELSTRFGLSRGAAVAAYEMLIADGFAEARIGAGTFVASAVPHLAEIAPPRARRPEPAPVLPGALGVASPDARTTVIFRRLMSTRLARPTPRAYHYGDPRGARVLREEIAAYLRAARGVRCDAETVVVTTGTQQGLDLVVRAALSPGDPVWIEDPCYPMALAALRGAGLRVTGVPVDAEGLDPALGETLAPGARAVYVTPSHQFPMGVAMTMRRRLALIEWARRTGAWIVEDDYDSEFRYAGAPLTALQGIDDAERVVYLGTFSKALHPGLRIAYAVLPEALLGPVLALRERTDRFPSTLADEALADLLREGHFAAHVRRARRRAEVARDALVEGLAAGGLAVAAPEQGLHLIANLPEGVEDAVCLPRLHAAGLGARALSSMAVGATRRNGLVIGFSGFPPDVLRAAVARAGPLVGAASPG
ncbi:PLP-dependent aminotransferase family protein [Pinisolibacter aquiterrae]|uniref:MocR-like pyridoxine biosynthesis transcription factor PdxR n=1 Tax=Pinisolibacter aquiterrae TaxID=2815579 RepID=UPI001C3C7D54|nr:PLP-dependent aminotransferase family protein [Pinisolibacter aquiterrae]MBV5264796.1 PLP-dependent aminotransferase family protein [Pinisolibacter aquiterrae]MCC8234215.1 PLP-dependent aminotransferase family protein [Pinisolibacter aquiterrae]